MLRRSQNCCSPAKHPLTAHGVHDATADLNILNNWWMRHPEANEGIATGRCSGLIAVDVDPRHGGDDTLRHLEREHGDLPPTWRFLTGGGGEHILFRHPGGRVGCSNGQIGPGIDVKADGGYIVGPGSVHISGGRYEISADHHPDDVPLAALPDWLLMVVRRDHRKRATPPDEWRRLVADGATEGQRNDSIASLAGHLLRKCVDPHVALELLRAWNDARCRPPLPDAEVVATVESIAQREIERRRRDHGQLER